MSKIEDRDEITDGLVDMIKMSDMAKGQVEELVRMLEINRELMEALDDHEAVFENLEHVVEKYGFQSCSGVIESIIDEEDREFLYEVLTDVWMEMITSAMVRYDNCPFFQRTAMSLLGHMAELQSIAGIEVEGSEYKTAMQLLVDQGLGYIEDGVFFVGKDKPNIMRRMSL